MPMGLIGRSEDRAAGSSSSVIETTTRTVGAPQKAGARRRVRTTGIAVTMAAGLLLSGCASPIIGALTIGEISTIAGLVSSFMSGRDLTEHALSAATGQDCRILESILRSDRGFCEDHGSAATAGDFRGVVAMLDGSNNSALAQADIEVRRATDPVALGFVPIDRRLAVEGFSLDAVQTTADSSAGRASGHRVSFGMLQSSYGQSWSYELTSHRDTSAREANAAPLSGQQVAVAEPTALSATRSDGVVIVPEPVTN